jgi:hypothetical protein
MVRTGFVVVLLGICSLGCGGKSGASGSSTPPSHGDHPEGTTVYDGGSGKTSWWKDTEGVDPEVAGCHVEFTGDGCAAAATPGRNFGEKCLPDDVLVETNPGADACHQHAGDIGHPYTVPCNDWCKDVYAIPMPTGPKQRGTAAAGGRCEVVAELSCGGGVVTSAKCVCQ